ncbi:hypothetical protein F5Y10DRAFT_253130 [Nemania abortiva]|nr:hypothetical protein F5Y10DRAFT_253130 [Nemania abortiva]
MLRTSQRLCRRALASPNSQSFLRNGAPSGCLHATITAPACPSRASLSSPRPRFFSVSHSPLAQPSRPLLREQQPPITATATTAAAAVSPPTETTETPPNNDASSSSSSPPSSSRRPPRGLIYACLFFIFGTVAGSVTSAAIAPPPLPPVGSELDLYLQEKIQARGLALPLVKELSADPSWTSWDAYAGIATTAPAVGDGARGISAAQSRITSGPMAGSSGLAFQRIFHNAATGEVVSVIYFGAGLAGWPGVVHGGALATVLDESLGRCAILKFPSRTGVTANLELQYRAPTRTNDFYVIRATPVVSDDDDVISKDGIRKGDRKLWVRGTLEREDGKVSVEAKALFVVPRAYKLRPLVEDF